WDFTGTALGSRNEQYERFYLGSVGRCLTHAHLQADRARANRLVDRFLLEELDEPAVPQTAVAAS
ncbi:MAG: 4-hydroxyphenylacetate 3-hydroxylase C-terminal domain-containing protein, partial [Reyranella sp.]|nr:4-hydroxyphenylacetate 3-hydroxylase C-terminal domain-containing protein [Reyranella sp.]